MKKQLEIKMRVLHKMLIGLTLMAIISGCTRKEEDLKPATFPTTPDVFTDGFSAGLEYAAFGNSKLTAFTVDEDVSFGSSFDGSSIRYDIPNVGDPEGTFGGGIFRDLGGRNLTNYDALTFYAKATKGGTIDVIGFGNDFMGDKYSATTSINIGTNWEKYIIPIPDPEPLTQEKGMLIFAEGPENSEGYSIWLDQVKFEKLGTIAHPRPAIFGGDDIVERGFIGVNVMITNLTQTFNLPNGADITTLVAPAYFQFNSTNPSVATVDEGGVVSIIGTGTTVITGTLGNMEAKGSLTLVSEGEFVFAPTPDRDPNNVISVFSDVYNNINVDYYNGFFQPFQTTLGGADLDINGDNIIRYTELNFVATQFTQPTLDATEMTHFHIDIQVEDNPIDPGGFIRIQLIDFGPDGAFGGGDDTSGSVTFTRPTLISGQWASLDIPLSSFSLARKQDLAQILFVSDATIDRILVDNMYFYK